VGPSNPKAALANIKQIGELSSSTGSTVHNSESLVYNSSHLSQVAIDGCVVALSVMIMMMKNETRVRAVALVEGILLRGRLFALRHGNFENSMTPCDHDLDGNLVLVLAHSCRTTCLPDSVIQVACSVQRRPRGCVDTSWEQCCHEAYNVTCTDGASPLDVIVLVREVDDTSVPFTDVATGATTGVATGVPTLVGDNGVTFTGIRLMRAGCARGSIFGVDMMTGIPVGVMVVTGDANFRTLTVRVGAGIMLPADASVPTKVDR
jgi:hypothetical protein